MRNLCLLNKKTIKKIILNYVKEDNWHELEVKSGNLGYGLVHYGLIRLYKPERVLVVGSKYGFVPAMCAMACRDNQYGAVDFVDAGYDDKKDKNHWGGAGFWKKTNAEKHFNKLKLSGFIRFYLMTSKEFAAGYPEREWGYVYLDGDHSYAGVKSDFGLFWPRLSQGGYLGLHDIYIKRQGGFDYGVIKLWKELKEKSLETLSFPGKYGLGLVKK